VLVYYIGSNRLSRFAVRNFTEPNEEKN